MTINRKLANTMAHRTKCFSLILGFMFVCAGGPAFAEQPLPGTVVTIKNGKSNYHLTQDNNGLNDSTRNVSVWPIPNPPNDGFLWYLEHPVIPHSNVIMERDEPHESQYWHLINVASGLRLTKDGNDRNVSDWTPDSNLHNNQLWKFIEGPNGEFHIVNKLEGMGLDQAYQGNRDDKRNVTVWPGQNFDDAGWSWYLDVQDVTGKLAKLTINSVKCYVPSSGKTLATDVAIGAVSAVAFAAAGPEVITSYILADVLFGVRKAEGKLPFELPSSKEAVEKQMEDVPYDSENPLYPFGYGLSQ